MKIALYWFRKDLRIQDNPGLLKLIDADACLFIYILETPPAPYALGEASRFWLHHSLDALQKSLAALGHTLLIFTQDPITLLPSLIKQYNVTHLYYSRIYEPWFIKRDTILKKMLIENNVCVESANASLLFEPWTIKNQGGEAYKVFTPFWKKGCLPRTPSLPRTSTIKKLPAPVVHSSSGGLASLNLLPSKKWSLDLAGWQPGEHGADNRLAAFIENGLQSYHEERNYPALDHTSRLSPHLHFGEISPWKIWHTIQDARVLDIHASAIDHFLAELGWREFSYHLLYHYPQLPTKNFRADFDSFPWKEDKIKLQQWQKGQTGYPIVDAGMRQLWSTGWMHNRVRMIVASFLVKHLLLDWRAGAAWFWDTLIDADLASNSASWQWVAGSGADAAPYFRIFNPILQGEKFDPEGIYIKKWVPELREVPIQFIHKPWEWATPPIEYPSPIVNHTEARETALEAFKTIR